MQQQSDQEHGYQEQPRTEEGRRALQLPVITANVGTQGYGGIQTSSRGTDRLAPFINASTVGSMSPVDPAPMPGEFYRNVPVSVVGSQNDHLSPSMMHNPKRAYRQRRKDPSCDACRERKVKCDATETTSCTECSSRNVRCQFTKDTNRRMSSIKQVQDLERQLQETKAQLDQLRATEYGAESHTPHLSASPEPDISEVGRSPRRMLKARVTQDLTASRAQLSDVARGIMKPPIAPATPNSPDRRSPPLSTLPSREIAQHCLDMYLECVHRHTSVVYWPQLCQDFWTCYSPEPTPQMDRETIALCFAILALGALNSPDSRIKSMSGEFINTSSSYMDFWADRIGIHQGLACFLVSIYLAETNSKSTSYVWLGSCIRIAQDKGLHVQGGHWSAVDGELRKRIWYSFYIYDRLIATELGRPMQINDEDCDTEYPGPLEEEERYADLFHPQKPTLLLASVHVSRLLAPLASLCRSLCITAEAINKFENHLTTCMQFFPPHLKLESNEPLDPLTIAPLVYFQNARILLHRHNMSPACSLEQRTMAIDKCTVAAQDTARIVSRCYQMAGSAEEVEQKLRAAASFFVCTHLWRCMLFLAFRQQWAAFDILLRFAALVDDSKTVNRSCGRHLSLFMDECIERHRQGKTQNLESDEALIVLLSGDLQAGRNSWVWGNAESGTLLSRRQKHSRSHFGGQDTSSSPQSFSRSQPWDSRMSNEELQHWGGWRGIHDAATWLGEYQRAHQPAHPQRPDSSQSRVDVRQDLGSQPEPSGHTPRSRMTIASMVDS